MTAADLRAADELRRLAGWNQTLEDWRRLLSLEPDGCFVAAQDDEVLATLTTTTYGQTLAWIGMMLVHPGHQRQGIGMRLMQHALEYLRHRKIGCIKLDATPAGQPLYEKLGFVREYTLMRHLREGERPREPSQCTRNLTETDWPSIDKLDATAFGAARSHLLRSLAQQSDHALLWPAKGPIRAFGLRRPGANAHYLGPVVCSSVEDAPALITTLLNSAKNRPVIWDTAAENTALAGHFGFNALRPLTRMRLGPSVASHPEWQFAIADPALG